jgi:EmrB/QacA subfamily drug resistance transporter
MLDPGLRDSGRKSLLKDTEEPKAPAASDATGPVAVVGTQKPAFLTVFPSIMLPMFLAVVDQTIVATALPAIAAALGNVARASWIVVSYLIASTVAAPIYGRLGDAFGRRRLMYVALAVFIAASLLCAVAQTIEQLTLARILQGLGGGGLMTLSQALIGEAIPPRERARYQGYLAAIAVCANSFGPIAGGALTEQFGWRSIFLVNVPIGLIAVGLTCRLPSRTVDRIPWKPDPMGLILFTAFVTAILLALEQTQRINLAALPLAGGLFVAGIIALALLVRTELRVPSPLIPVGLLKQPAIWHSDAMAAFHGASLVSLITFVPVYLEVVRGMSPSAVGVLLVPLTIGIGTGSLITGRMVSRTGLTMVFPIYGLVLVTATQIVLAFWAGSLDVFALAVLMLFDGLFFGTVMGVVQVTVQSAAGPRRLGEAAASVQFSRSIGAGFGTAIVATVLFAVLSLKNSDAARAFASMVQHGHGLGSTITAEQRAAIQGDIADAFRAAFLTIAAFTTAGFFLALTNPLKKI